MIHFTERAGALRRTATLETALATGAFHRGHRREALDYRESAHRCRLAALDDEAALVPDAWLTRQLPQPLARSG